MRPGDVRPDDVRPDDGAAFDLRDPGFDVAAFAAFFTAFELRDPGFDAAAFCFDDEPEPAAAAGRLVEEARPADRAESPVLVARRFPPDLAAGRFVASELRRFDPEVVPGRFVRFDVESPELVISLGPLQCR